MLRSVTLLWNLTEANKKQACPGWEWEKGRRWGGKEKYYYKYQKIQSHVSDPLRLQFFYPWESST